MQITQTWEDNHHLANFYLNWLIITVLGYFEIACHGRNQRFALKKSSSRCFTLYQL